MDIIRWLHDWLARHPLNESSEAQRRQYTAEVMARVHALEHPRRAVAWPAPVRPWRDWFRLALPAAATAAVIVLAISVIPQAMSRQRAQQITREAQQLAEWAGVEEDERSWVTEPEPETLAEELQLHDALQFAEEIPSEERQLEEALQLLEQLDAAPASADVAGDGSDSQEWLEEFQSLDENDLVAAS